MYKDTDMPDKIPGDEYLLYMDKETAATVALACEFYARVKFGQFNEIQHLTVWPNGDNDPTFGDRLQACEEALNAAKKAAYPELSGPGHSYGVGRFRDADTAWNAYQAIRYMHAWHEHPEGGTTINFSPPRRFSDAPMPRCEIRDGDAEWHDCFVDPKTGELVDITQAIKDAEERERRRGEE